MTLYLKGLQKYNRSKLKLLNYLNKSKAFIFDLSPCADIFKVNFALGLTWGPLHSNSASLSFEKKQFK